MSFATRRFVIGAVAAMVLAASAFGQGQGRFDPKQMVDRQIEGMKNRLSLTADQEKKVRPILVESMKKSMAAREKAGPPEPGQTPPKEVLAEMAKIRKETNEKLGEVLSADQMKKYEAMMQERRGGGKKGGEAKQ